MLSQIDAQLRSCKSMENKVFKEDRVMSFFKRYSFQVIGGYQHCLNTRKRNLFAVKRYEH